MVNPISSPLTFWSSGPFAPELAPRAWHRRLRYTVLSCALLAMTSAAAHAVTHPTTKKTTSGKTHRTATAHHYAALPPGFHWRISNWNPMFPGSHELLVQQNQELDRSQSFRVTNEIDLIQHEVSQELVPVSETEALKLASNLTDNRRYCRPWTRDFLQDFSQDR